MADRLTVGSFAADIGEHAGIDALQADAALPVRAVVVRPTASLALVVLADLVGRTVHVDDALHVLAGNTGIAGVLERTGAEGLVVDRLADGARSAGRRTGAHVHALPVDAGVSGGTLGVGATAADALAALADRPPRADVIIGADGAAQAVDALLIVEALAVGEALLPTVRGLAATASAAAVHRHKALVIAAVQLANALHVGVAQSALSTGADTFVRLHGAEGVRAAGRRAGAGVHAEVVDARLAGGAVRVGATAHRADVLNADLRGGTLAVLGALHVAASAHAALIHGAVLAGGARLTTAVVRTVQATRMLTVGVGRAAD